jgi:3-isopropylmalate dehydratase small subunit
LKKKIKNKILTIKIKKKKMQEIFKDMAENKKYFIEIDISKYYVQKEVKKQDDSEIKQLHKSVCLTEKNINK